MKILRWWLIMQMLVSHSHFHSHFHSRSVYQCGARLVIILFERENFSRLKFRKEHMKKYVNLAHDRHSDHVHDIKNRRKRFSFLWSEKTVISHGNDSRICIRVWQFWSGIKRCTSFSWRKKIHSLFGNRQFETDVNEELHDR